MNLVNAPQMFFARYSRDVYSQRKFPVFRQGYFCSPQSAIFPRPTATQNIAHQSDSYYADATKSLLPRLLMTRTGAPTATE